METFSVTFTGVATLLAIGILGFWLLRRNVFGSNILQPLSFLAIDIALPCLIFANITDRFAPLENRLWWTLPLWWAGFTCVLAVLSLIMSLAARKDFRREFLTCIFYQNGIFFPLAVMASMFGPESSHLVDLFLFTLVYPAFLFNTAPFLMNPKRFKPDIRRLGNPVMIATIIAVILKISGGDVYLPKFLISGIRMTGQMSIPLLMIVLGGNIFLDFKRGDRLFIFETLKFVAFKNFVMPAAVLGILVLMRPDYSIALIIILQAAVPPITAAPIIIERENGNRSIANQFIVASFLASLLSLPLTIMVFNLYFRN